MDKDIQIMHALRDNGDEMSFDEILKVVKITSSKLDAYLLHLLRQGVINLVSAKPRFFQISSAGHDWLKQAEANHKNQDEPPHASQMTLRDHFAGAALQGLLANPKLHPEILKQGQSWIESSAWAWADEMMKVRSK